MEHDDDRELSRRVADAYSRVGPPDATAKARLMERLHRESKPRPELSPRPLRFFAAGRYGTVALAAAASLVIGTVLGWVLHDRQGAPAAPAMPSGIAEVSTTRELRLVQFVLTAPKASQVTVVGDFNSWDPVATPMVRRESGAWTAAIPVSSGRHVYAFIVDGDRWVADPAAPLAPEDGFGIRNSVIVVGGQESS
jgi:hypothetical protein